MNIKELAYIICQKRESVIKLNSKNLKEYKNKFYSQPFRIWQLDLLSEHIWGDISFKEIKNIFKL